MDPCQHLYLEIFIRGGRKPMKEDLKLKKVSK